LAKWQKDPVFSLVVLQYKLLEEVVLPNYTSMNWTKNLESLATLFLETQRSPATRITGYFENVIPKLSDSMFKHI